MFRSLTYLSLILVIIQTNCFLFNLLFILFQHYRMLQKDREGLLFTYKSTKHTIKVKIQKYSQHLLSHMMREQYIAVNTY